MGSISIFICMRYECTHVVLKIFITERELMRALRKDRNERMWTEELEKWKLFKYSPSSQNT